MDPATVVIEQAPDPSKIYFIGLQRIMPVDVSVLQRAVDALCNAHKFCLHIDAARTILAGEEAIEESALTQALDRSTQEIRKVLEDHGIAW